MVKATIDTTRFDRDFALYKEQTSKALVDAINYKLFDCARACIKGTGKANKTDIKSSLMAASNKCPARTVAEMMVILKHRRTGEEIQDLEGEAEALIKSRQSHTGFAKAGWIPALKDLIGRVGRESVSVAGVGQVAYGGATPARQMGSTVAGDVFNDVAGTGNKAFVEQLKEKGAQVGLDKVAADMETYLAKKLDIPIERFNAA